MKTGENMRKNLKLVKALIKSKIPDKTDNPMTSNLDMTDKYAVMILKILRYLNMTSDLLSLGETALCSSCPILVNNIIDEI